MVKHAGLAWGSRGRRFKSCRPDGEIGRPPLRRMPPDLCPDLGELLIQLIISGSSVDLAGWLISASARVSGANLEHRYALNYAEQRPTELNFTAATCEFYISAGPAVVRTSLGVKGSQVQILSSRRRDRAAFSTEGAARFAS